MAMPEVSIRRQGCFCRRHKFGKLSEWDSASPRKRRELEIVWGSRPQFFASIRC